jgi:hypothetical protein
MNISRLLWPPWWSAKGWRRHRYQRLVTLIADWADEPDEPSDYDYNAVLQVWGADRLSDTLRGQGCGSPGSSNAPTDGVTL